MFLKFIFLIYLLLLLFFNIKCKICFIGDSTTRQFMFFQKQQYDLVKVNYFRNDYNDSKTTLTGASEIILKNNKKIIFINNWCNGSFFYHLENLFNPKLNPHGYGTQCSHIFFNCFHHDVKSMVNNIKNATDFYEFYLKKLYKNAKIIWILTTITNSYSHIQKPNEIIEHNYKLKIIKEQTYDYFFIKSILGKEENCFSDNIHMLQPSEKCYNLIYKDLYLNSLYLERFVVVD